MEQGQREPTPVQRQLQLRNFLLEDEEEQDYLLNRARDPFNTFSLRNPYSDRSLNIKEETLTIHKVHVDSRNRRRVPEHIFSWTAYLEPSSLFLTAGSAALLVRLPNHGLTVDDRVALTGLRPQEFRLKNALSFEIGSALVQVAHPAHGITQEMVDNVPFQLEMAGVAGPDNRLFGLPVSLLNAVHDVVLRKQPADPVDPDRYFVRLPAAAAQSGTDSSGTIFTIRFLNVFGVPISQINATYPISRENVRGFHNVAAVVDADSFEVTLGVRSVVSVAGGFGEGVVVQRIASTQPAYPRSNEYAISFPTPFKNVSYVRIINSEFPVVRNLIRAGVNNVFQLQVLNDGDALYEVRLPDGNYTFPQLVAELEGRLNALPRVGRSGELEQDNANAPLAFRQTLGCAVSFSIEKNLIEFAAFDEANILAPLEADPAAYPDLRTRVLVNYRAHGLLAGAAVELRGAVDLGTIPAAALQGRFAVEAVVDANTFRVALPRFNPLAVPGSTPGGGNEVIVRTPLSFRLLFSDAASVGGVLGFRNPGQPDSVTPYGTSISNQQPYANDLLVDALGNPVTIQPSFQLATDNYIFLATDLVTGATNTNGVQNALAKIGLYGDNGTYVYDSHTQLARPFDENVSELPGLTLRFVDASGALYEFYDYEHSFVLEVYEERSGLLTTNRSTRT